MASERSRLSAGELTYSALVVMVIVTTMITPPALKWSLARGIRAG